MAQCLGRLVRDSKGVGLLAFEDGAVFHVPFRCTTMTRSGDICDSCVEREQKTIEKVRGITGTTIKGMLPSYLNGRVTEPIPFWSRLYDGAWYRLKIQGGSTISEAVMAKAKKAAEVAYEGVTTVEPQPMPGGKKPRAKKKVEVAVAVAVVAPVAVAVAVAAVAVAPVAVAVAPAPAPTKKPKKAPKDDTPPVAVLDPKKLPVESVVTIQVRKTEVDGRSLYLDPRKEKLYDLKFKYIGRLKDGQIHSFPDSDAEL
jgi:hypothetical protein